MAAGFLDFSKALHICIAREGHRSAWVRWRQPLAVTPDLGCNVLHMRPRALRKIPGSATPHMRRRRIYRLFIYGIPSQRCMLLAADQQGNSVVNFVANRARE